MGVNQVPHVGQDFVPNGKEVGGKVKVGGGRAHRVGIRGLWGPLNVHGLVVLVHVAGQWSRTV